MVDRPKSKSQGQDSYAQPAPKRQKAKEYVEILKPGEDAEQKLRAVRSLRPKSDMWGSWQTKKQINTKKCGTTTLAFAARLVALRRAAGLTQVQMAERAGITQSYLSKLERGTLEPSFPTLFALAKALNCPASSLLEGVSE
ncbi:helix-turn-helix domain-containing protein (plasmid) [Skermanella rosea]|uniref:helix-turn-helix domain-containing protein n=1 Tax=Skermanella rosea TaxID=1817965 RepID=UPI001E4F879C|nr:helix-turn-helix transcriptional regulator [Skermanella rosea]UEM08041.1 helix-turn-helix domain-containing protein [Skermanella rosea]